MQRCLSTSTIPSARLNEAVVGHTSTHGGCSQCWHIIGSDSSRPLLVSLISTLRIHCEAVAPVAPERPFSRLQAATQSSHPLLHCVVSISIPQRTFQLAGCGLPCAV